MATMCIILLFCLATRYHSVQLTTLLWVSQGRNIVRDGHGVVVSVPGSMTRSNYYLVSRMFWTSDITRSSVSWGQNDPNFNFRQVCSIIKIKHAKKDLKSFIVSKAQPHPYSNFS